MAFSDEKMYFNEETKRYVLREEYVRTRGIDLSLELETEHLPEPSKAPEIALERVSLLVYSNIYNYGRQRKEKEYIMEHNEIYREPLLEAMLERLKYMLDSGDLSTRSGALITQGTRVEVKDLIPSVMEEMILRPTGLLHRGKYTGIFDV